MPNQTHTLLRYRLLARPPFQVSFPSTVYEITIEPVFGAPQWSLLAKTPSGRPRWTLCQAGEERGRLEFIIYGEAGFEILRPSGPSVILDQMCQAGQAEITWPPSCRGRPPMAAAGRR